ncbi:copper resistance CopC family protein [Nocardioides aquiterrae]|uniref:CopC domain-containing protein n=1 Tax=Nocardioides aquiterrae TaxID=203799 RepID=A0ABP4F0W5_9ACTN
MTGRRLAGAALAAVLLVLALAAPVGAHATAVAAWPAPGQVLTASPDRVVIEFSTEVQPQVQVAVVGPDGEPLAVGDPVVEGRYVSQAIRQPDRPGAYVAAFHAVGVDLHPVMARVDYRVDPDAAATENPAGDPPDLAATAPAPAEAGGNQLPALLLLVGVGVLVGVTVLHLVSRRTVGPRR